MKFTSFQKQVSINKAKFLGGRTFFFFWRNLEVELRWLK